MLREKSKYPLCTVAAALMLVSFAAASNGDSGPASDATTAAPANEAAEPGEPDPSQEAENLEQRVADLERQLASLSAESEAAEAEDLVRDAEAEASGGGDEAEPDEREFLEGSLALQKLNPELTLCADFVAGLVIDESKFYAGESDRSRMAPRGVGLHFQHVLDPFSMFKSAFHFSPEHGVGVEEVYVSWTGLLPSTTLTVGRFRQSFGVLNRWHEHDLDQSQHPLAARLVLGDEGLVGDGVDVRWLMPRLWAHANELTLEVVDGDNEILFSGQHFSRPATLLRLKSYYDLSKDTYLDLGLSGMLGYNNRRGLLNDEGALVDEPWRRTVVAGADLTILWQPLQRAKYRSFTWRSELYYSSRQLPQDAPDRTRSSWGLYSYVQSQLSPRWFVGLRGDVALPTVRESSQLAWDLVPYLTFWQSEFVYLRLEYQHGRRLPYLTPSGSLGRRTDNRLLLQIDFAAGPHKHEKY